MGYNEDDILEKKDSDGKVIEYKRSKNLFKENKGAENITLIKDNIPSHRHFGAKIGNYQGLQPSPDDEVAEASNCDFCGSGSGRGQGGNYTSFWGGDKDKKTKEFSILPHYKVLNYIMKISKK
jgi:hypothetical protein